MSRSVLPHRRLLSLEERLEHAAARPVIIPETIVCDRGKAFISENFHAACRTLEINFQPCHHGEDTVPGGEQGGRGVPVGERPGVTVQENQLRAIAPVVMNM
jgi:hypothetical protein